MALFFQPKPRFDITKENRMTRWFRLYDDLLDDPKAQRLDGDLFKAWINLFCLASKNDGKLPPLDDVAFSLRLPIDKVSEILEALKNRGLLDVSDDGLEPHNWSARQYKSDRDITAAERQKRKRDREKEQRVIQENVTRDITDMSQTPEQSRTDTEAEAEAEKNKLSLIPKETPKVVSHETKTTCGSRLPENWSPNPDLMQFAFETLGDLPSVNHEIAQFTDYWRALSGAKAVKLDWDATFRNWVRNGLQRKQKRFGASGSKSGATDLLERFLNG